MPMDEKSAEQILGERFEALPPSLKEAILSVDLREELKAVADETELRVDQAGNLENETVLVMMGMEPTEDYADNLARELDISGEKAQNIAEAVNERIFLPIRDAMQQVGPSETREQEPSEVPTMKEQMEAAAQKKEHRHEAAEPEEEFQTSESGMMRGITPSEQEERVGQAEEENEERDSALASLEEEVNAVDAAAPPAQTEEAAEKEVVEPEIDKNTESSAKEEHVPPQQQATAPEEKAEEGQAEPMHVRSAEPGMSVPAEEEPVEKQGAQQEQVVSEQKTAPQKKRPSADPEEGTQLSVEEIRERKQKRASGDPYREPIE